MIPLDAFARTQIARVAVGLYNLQVGKDTMDWALGALESGEYASVGDLANWVYTRDFSSMSNQAMAVRLTSNLNITGAQAQADALAYIVATLDAKLIALDAKTGTILWRRENIYPWCPMTNVSGEFYCDFHWYIPVSDLGSGAHTIEVVGDPNNSCNEEGSDTVTVNVP